MTDVEYIIGRPFAADIPRNVAKRYTLALELILTANEDNFEAICQYVSRDGFSDEYSLMVVCEASRRNIKLLETEAFKDWAKAHKHLTP